MKKYLFLVFLLSLFSCTGNINDSLPLDINYSSEYISSFSEEITSEEESIEEEKGYEVIEVNSNSCKIKLNGKIIEYNADVIVNGTTYETEKNLYLTEKGNVNNFIVINGGKLIINETTLVKKGEARNKDIETLRFGLNASILVIGENSLVQISDVAINVFAPYSSAIHCIENGRAEIKNADILVVSEASHAYSTYQNGVIVSESILTLVDSKDVVAFIIYENGGFISVLGDNNYIEVHGSPSYVGILYSGIMVLKNIYGYSENKTLFDIKEGAELTLYNALIQET